MIFLPLSLMYFCCFSILSYCEYLQEVYREGMFCKFVFAVGVTILCFDIQNSDLCLYKSILASEIQYQSASLINIIVEQLF